LSLALLWSGTSFAAIDKCQKRIQGEGAKLQKFIYSAVQKCADAIRKEKAAGAVKGGTDCSSGKACLANAAIFCEKQLAAVYDAANAKPDKSKIELFRATLEKSSATNECTDDDLRILQGMGHQLSGTANLATAPPVSGSCDFNGDGKVDTNCRLTFLIDWLTYAIEDATIRQLQAQTPDLLALLKEAIDASVDPVSGKRATDCTGSPPPGTEYRPNLCRFGPQCFTSACTLSVNSQAELQAPAVWPLLNSGNPFDPIDLAGSVPVQICRPGPTVSVQRGLGGEFHAQPDVLYIVGGPANSVAASSIPLGLSTFFQAACISVVGQQGWCDCSSSGLGVAKNATVCADRSGACDLSANPTNPTCTAISDECGVPIGDWVADSQSLLSWNFHAPTFTISTSGSSQPGDCVDLVTLQFTVLTSGDKGADGIACTADDTAAPLATLTVPLTTGTVNADLRDAIYALGQCAGDGSLCIRNADCGVNGPCNSPAPDVRDVLTTVIGSKGTCNEYRAANLSNLKLVTGVALADLSVLPSLSVDGWLTVQLDCQ
jgi:hypothetical protein